MTSNRHSVNTVLKISEKILHRLFSVDMGNKICLVLPYINNNCYKISAFYDKVDQSLNSTSLKLWKGTVVSSTPILSSFSQSFSTFSASFTVSRAFAGRLESLCLCIGHKWILSLWFLGKECLSKSPLHLSWSRNLTRFNVPEYRSTLSKSVFGTWWILSTRAIVEYFSWYSDGATSNESDEHGWWIMLSGFRKLSSPLRCRSLIWCSLVVAGISLPTMFEVTICAYSVPW